MHTSHYQIGHLSLCMQQDATTAADRPEKLTQRLRTWFNLSPTDSNKPWALSLQIQHNGGAEVNTSAAPVDERGALIVWRTEAGWLVRCGTSSMRVQLGESRALCTLGDDFWTHPVHEQREFFLFALQALLRQHGLHCLYANGVSLDGQGLLLLGNPMSGKTTLTLSLVQQGWRYVAEDHLLLYHSDSHSDGHIDALALRRGFSCRKESVAHFCGADTPSPRSLDLGDGRALYPVESIDIVPQESAVQPGAIVFLQIDNSVPSHLQEMETTAAFAQLLPFSAGLHHDRSRVAEWMRILQRLTTQVSAFHLTAGRDVFERPAHVSSLLRKVLAA